MTSARWMIVALIAWVITIMYILGNMAGQRPDPCQEFRAAFAEYVSYNGHPTKEASDRYMRSLANRPYGCTANGR